MSYLHLGSSNMPRVFLFAFIGGALVVLCAMALRFVVLAARKRALEHRIASQEAKRIQQASLEPGASESNPLIVHSPSVVESRASSMPCVRCEGPVKVLEHQARTLDGTRFRVAITKCSMCGFEREIFFRISTEDQS